MYLIKVLVLVWGRVGFGLRKVGFLISLIMRNKMWSVVGFPYRENDRLPSFYRRYVLSFNILIICVFRVFVFLYNTERIASLVIL